MSRYVTLFVYYLLCPDINTIGSPTKETAKYLASLLKPHLGKNGYHHLTNSATLVHSLDELVLSRGGSSSEPG